MRRIYLLLLVVVILVNLSVAQDMSSAASSTLGSSTIATRPSAADCYAAASSSGVVPPGCGSDSNSTLGGTTASTGSSRQMQELTPLQTPQLTTSHFETMDRETSVPVNPPQRKKPDLPLKPHTEFEQIVADTVGRPLPLFGQSLFTQPPSTFAPIDRIQIPSDYIVGLQDELQIRIWGQLNADLRVVVDRAGQIFIPRVGQIPVAGVRYSELDQHLKSKIAKLYHNFDLTATIGKIHSIQIFVVGQARYPGTYTISSLSTMVNAVFASGGPMPQGSLRDLQIQRDGKTIAHLDFYDFLVKGDKSKDVRLQSGDVLYFPPVGPLVAVAGSVNTPAIYEMKQGSPLSELIEVAGGLSAVADSNKITLERIGDRQLRSVRELPFDAQSRTLSLNNGDIVRVLSIVPRFSDAVTLRGHVVNPGRYPWKSGMRVRDLIPNAQALLTRPYWVGRASMTNGRSTEYPIRPKFPTNSKKLELSAEDANKLSQNEQQSVEQRDQEFIAQLGQQGPSSETLARDLHQTSPEINWSYAIVQRVNPVDLSTRLLSFDLGKAVLEGDAANNLELEPDDIITVFSQANIAVPQNQCTRYVRLEGEVLRAGVYKLQEGELLRDVLKRAGGVTPEAYIYGTELTRESARVAQQKSIDEMVRELELQIRQSSIALAAHGGGEGQALAASQEPLVEKMRNLKATGRIVLTLKPTASSIGDYPPIVMEDNDRVVIPHRPSTVSVMGMVYNPGSFVFDPRRNAGAYLKMAGKGKPGADMKHAFVLHADGTVVASTSVNSTMGGDRFSSMRMYPGDQLVVPNKIPTGAFMRGLRDWTQLGSQFAMGGAALAVIGR